MRPLPSWRWNQVLLNLTVTAGQQGRCSESADPSGAVRELNAQQVGVIIAQLEREYAFSSIDGNAALRTAAGTNPQMAIRSRS